MFTDQRKGEFNRVVWTKPYVWLTCACFEHFSVHHGEAVLACSEDRKATRATELRARWSAGENALRQRADRSRARLVQRSDLGEAAVVLAHHGGVGTVQLLDDLKALIELREDVHHRAGEQSVLRRRLELRTTKGNGKIYTDVYCLRTSIFSRLLAALLLTSLPVSSYSQYGRHDHRFEMVTPGCGNESDWITAPIFYSTNSSGNESGALRCCLFMC